MTPEEDCPNTYVSPETGIDRILDAACKEYSVDMIVIFQRHHLFFVF
jgi:hypothetical protein